MLSEFLLDLGRDLTLESKEGLIDTIVGRDSEIRNLIKVLSLKKKNNPIIVGESGVGKTALVEGLARKIALGDVPDSLKSKTIFELDMNTLNSYKSSGRLESVIKEMMSEIQRSNGNILLFIDEIHRITGDGISDVGNLMKPYLARNFGVIGCTTLAEYRHILKDPALERRFQQIVVNEPSITDTISILRGVKQSYEIYHRVTIKDSALVSAVKMTDRYLTDSFLPDKALTVLDEACANLRVALDSKPDEIYDLEQKVVNYQIEYNSLNSENDSSENIERILEIKDEYLSVTSELERLNNSWEEDKLLVDKIVTLQESRLACSNMIEDMKPKGYNEKLAQLTQELKMLDSAIEQLEEIKEDKMKEGSILRSDVNHDSIAEAISVKTGIPVNRMLTEDKEKILELPKVLAQRVIGQDHAIQEIYKGILRSKSGVQSRTKPNSYLFLGSSGTGKTELAKAVTEQLYDSSDSIVRLDMSEYMEKHSVNRLTGSPPGYVGYEEGGQLTEAIFRNPYSLILFDEIEKAHPDVLLTLLQVLDDGRLTDNKGRVVDFKNTLIIMTSNVGSEKIIEDIKLFKEIKEDTKNRINDLLQTLFRPEFVNRIDGIVYFNPLNKETVLKIVSKQEKLLNKRLSEELKIGLELSGELKQYISDNGFSLELGARPLVRFFENTVEYELSLKLMKGEINEGTNYYVYLDENNKIIFREEEQYVRGGYVAKPKDE